MTVRTDHWQPKRWHRCRDLVIDWMIDVQQHTREDANIVIRAVILLDELISTATHISEIQALAVVCLYFSSNMELEDLVYFTKDAFTVSDMKKLCDIHKHAILLTLPKIPRILPSHVAAAVVRLLLSPRSFFYSLPELQVFAQTLLIHPVEAIPGHPMDPTLIHWRAQKCQCFLPTAPFLSLCSPDMMVGNATLVPTDAETSWLFTGSHDSCVLGAGTNGLVIPDPTDATICYKLLQPANESRIERALFSSAIELVLVSQLNHPSLLHAHQVILNPHFHVPLALCLPRLSKNLLAMSDKVYTRPLLFRQMVYEILHGVSYLHHCGVMHGDIKPENILLTLDHQHVCLIDFSNASVLEPSDQCIDRDRLLCSPWYRPPEYLNTKPVRQQRFSTAADIWALGLTLLQVISPDFSVLLERADAHDQNTGEWTQLENLGSRLRVSRFVKNADLRQLLQHMLEVDPTKRITAKQALELPMFRTCHLVCEPQPPRPCAIPLSQTELFQWAEQRFPIVDAMDRQTLSHVCQVIMSILGYEQSNMFLARFNAELADVWMCHILQAADFCWLPTHVQPTPVNVSME